MGDNYLVDQPTAAPTRKLSASTGYAGLVTLIVTLLAQFNVVIPADVSTAVVAVIGGLIVIVQFVAGYFTRERKQ